MRRPRHTEEAPRHIHAANARRHMRCCLPPRDRGGERQTGFLPFDECPGGTSPSPSRQRNRGIEATERQQRRDPATSAKADRSRRSSPAAAEVAMKSSAKSADEAQDCRRRDEQPRQAAEEADSQQSLDATACRRERVDRTTAMVSALSPPQNQLLQEHEAAWQ